MPLKCPFCGSGNVVRRGKRRNESGSKQRFSCKRCNKRFVTNDGFQRMRHKATVIVRAVHMHQDGLSLFQVQNHLWQHDNARVSRQTLWKWEKKYSDFLKSVARKRHADNQRMRTRRWEIHLCRQGTRLRFERNRLENKVRFSAFLRRKSHDSCMREIPETDKDDVLQTNSRGLRKGKAQTCQEAQIDHVRDRRLWELQKCVQQAFLSHMHLTLWRANCMQKIRAETQQQCDRTVQRQDRRSDENDAGFRKPSRCRKFSESKTSDSQLRESTSRTQRKDTCRSCRHWSETREKKIIESDQARCSASPEKMTMSVVSEL